VGYLEEGLLDAGVIAFVEGYLWCTWSKGGTEACDCVATQAIIWEGYHIPASTVEYEQIFQQICVLVGLSWSRAREYS
jgi:hypothetical protein